MTTQVSTITGTIRGSVSRLIARLFGSSALKAKLAKGGMWLTAGSFGADGLRMARNMVLARILVPDAFGQVAIIFAVNALFEAFTQVGLKEAVVQHPDGERREYLNSVFWVGAVRSLILYGVAFLSIPFVTAFYNKQDLIPMMQVAFLSILFLGLLSPRAYAELKVMNYRKWVMVFHGGNALGLTTSLVLGIIFRNAWALVIGFVGESFFRFLISYIVAPFLPRFTIDRESLRDLMKFVRGIFGLPILTFLFTRLDIFVLGKFVDDGDLGRYSLAVNLAQIPFIVYSAVLNPLLLPAFSSLRDNSERLNGAILKASGYINGLFLTGVAILVCFAYYILRIVYGAEYTSVSFPFQLLCISIGIKATGTILVNSLFALGKPQFTREAAIIRVVVMAAALIPLIALYGLAGAALAGCAASFAWLVVLLFRARASLELPIHRFLGSLRYGIAGGGAVILLFGIVHIIMESLL